MESCEKHLFQGVHVLGEIYGVSKDLLNDSQTLEYILRKGIEQCGATICGLQTKQFDPTGVTVLALLSESHASLHTYPDQGSLFFDAFTCGTVCQPQRIAEVLIESLQPTHHNLQTVLRGDHNFLQPVQSSAGSSISSETLS